MRYYLEFSGGLGDILNQIYMTSAYRGLVDLWADDEAIVGVFSHNPFAWEIFEWHPKRPQMSVHKLPYLHNSEIQPDRHKYSRGGVPLESTRQAVKFFPAPADEHYLRDLRIEQAVVMSPTAGLPDRSIPDKLVADIVNRLIERGRDIIFVGRNYERFGRREYDPPVHQQVHNLIDVLSVPGVMELVRRAAGLVTCHSALNIAAWHLKTPQLLMYPPSVYFRHFLGARNEWSFGLDWDITVHSIFDSYSNASLDSFCKLVDERVRREIEIRRPNILRH